MLLGLALGLIGSATRVSAQAPALLWSTNIGATLFAVDNQTNSYANVGTNIIKMNPAGVAISTNSICPLPGVAQLDAAGNYYFAGNFDGTQNFGGITLVGGWTNYPIPTPHYTPGYPTHFVTKYNSAGVLQWVKSFGAMGQTGNILRDIVVDSLGGVYAGHIGHPGGGYSPHLFTRIDSSGNILWSQSASTPGGFTSYVKIGGLTSSNFFLLYYNFGVHVARKDLSGNNVGLMSEVFYPMVYNSADVLNGVPVIDNLANVFIAGRTNTGSGNQLLRKFDVAGTLLLEKVVNHGEQWSLARDASETFYFGSVSNILIRYDANGNELWTTNYNKKAVKMIVHSSGNRFVGFSDGSIARLQVDFTPQPPSIITGPQDQIVQLGANAAFFANVSGSPTLNYQWRKDGTNLPSATATNYTIIGVTTNHIGSYAVVVTNVYGSVTSTPPASLLIAPSLVSPFNGTIGVWGQQATLSVTAFGSGTLSYQWYNAGQLVGGATNNTLVFPSLQITNAGLYSVVVTSQYGVVTNTPAALVVNPANVSLGLYAGVIIDGTTGYTYGIEYATNLQNATWQSLTNITLTQPVQIWVDTSVNVPNAPKRFYRVTSQ